MPESVLSEPGTVAPHRGGCCTRLLDENKLLAVKIPVILDTDIGGDIDDTWALAMLLKSPELDIRLAVGDTGNALYRAQLIARMLEIAKRADIPVGIGLNQGEEPDRENQKPWIRDYRLDRYPGTIHADGVQAIIDAIMTAPGPVTLLCIGPVPNIAEALRREPRIAPKSRLVGMFGSVRRGYDGSPNVAAEFNVVKDVRACQALFTAPWAEMVITPLDTCGIVRLEGEKYKAVCLSTDPLARAVIENYRIWLQGAQDAASSILFDTVAAYLAFADDLLVMEDLRIRVTDDGYTRIDDKARPMRVATGWKDLGAFEDLLVRRLTGAA
jgi:inosine-uridine nucleoside N-ribohydrolase